MTRIYIAGSYVLQRELKVHRNTLRSMGFVVESSWLDQIGNAFPTFAVGQESAIRDLQELARADILILDATTPSTSGGMHVELGYALGLGKPVYLIGRPHNIFHYLYEVYTVPDWPTMYEKLQWLSGFRTPQPGQAVPTHRD